MKSLISFQYIPFLLQLTNVGFPCLQQKPWLVQEQGQGGLTKMAE